jgi:transcriptional regulator with XRE-family HTH domain
MQPKIFAEVLKELRTSRGLSQEELSTKANLHRTYVSHLEREARSPSLKTLVKICSVLSILPSTMMRMIEERDQATFGETRTVEPTVYVHTGPQGPSPL